MNMSMNERVYMNIEHVYGRKCNIVGYVHLDEYG